MEREIIANQSNARNRKTKLVNYNFTIKKGVCCSWCAELMKKTLRAHFAIKDIEMDIPKNKVHLITYKKINPAKIISLLKKRGYHLI